MPELTVVIDHLAKPDYSVLQPEWVDAMRTLSERPGTYVKISGLATEVSGRATPDRFQRHVDLVLDAFGSTRCMLGSDWPVSTLAMSYAETVALLEAVTADADADALWRGSATAAYRLPDAARTSQEDLA